MANLIFVPLIDNMINIENIIIKEYKTISVEIFLKKNQSLRFLTSNVNVFFKLNFELWILYY